MRYFLFALLVVALQAAPVRAQDSAPFDWSTSVIFGIADDAQASDRLTPASNQPAAASPSHVSPATLDDLPAGCTISVSLRHATANLINAARAAGIHVLAEVDSRSIQTEPAAEAVRSGLAGFIFQGEPGDAARFRDSIASLLPPESVVRVAGTSQSANGDEPTISDPPPKALAPDAEWDAVYEGANLRNVVRIRLDRWPPDVHIPLMLARGGIYLEGERSETTAAVAAFRARHPAVGAGRHEPLVNSVYTFHRSVNMPAGPDDVVVVLGATGKTSINLSRVFDDDTLLRDALTGATSFVSFGMASFDAHPSGVILIEELR